MASLSRSKRCRNARRRSSVALVERRGSECSTPAKSGRFDAARRTSARPLFEMPTNGDASTVRSAVSS